MDNPANQSGEPTAAVEDPPPSTQDSTSDSSSQPQQQQQQHRPQPPLSPLTGSYLLIVVGEPHSDRHKEIILQKIAKAFLSWDVAECHVNLEKELQIITGHSPEGEEARYGERLIQYATENLVTEILIHPQLNTLHQCLKNLLSSFTKHRHIIHAGYTFAGNGSWILQDGTLSISDLIEALHEPEVLRVLKAYENSVSIDVHCAPEGEWTTERFQKEPVTKLCTIRINPGDVMTSGNPAISAFIDYLSPFLEPANIQHLLQPTDVVGNIRFTHPTLYVFPGGQGDAALFGINGFNMLIDGGFARKACFWDFARHLDRLDAVLLTRLNNSTVNGISAVLQRKKMNHVYPQIGHFFCNLQDRKIALSPDGDKDKDSLIVNLAEEGQEIVANLRHLALKPHPCYRDGNQVDPVNLYHKVGHGKLDMYVISPARDSQAVKEFLAKWTSNDSHLFSNTGKKLPGKTFEFPLQNLVSICALLVWQPANPEDTITRILFPGSTPQHKIFEGLEKLRHLEFLKHPVCSAKSISPSVSTVTVARSLSKTKQPKPATDNKQKETKVITKPQTKPAKPKTEKTPPKEVKSKLDNKLAEEKNELENLEEPLKKLNNRILSKDEQIENIKKEIQKIEQAENDEQKKKIVHRSKYDMRNVKSKVDSRAPSKSVDRKKMLEKKPEGEASPPGTPKKALTNGTATKAEKAKVASKLTKDPSPTSTPAKSAKEANNRKVVESRVTTRAPSKSLPKKKEETPSAVAKIERRPISRRPKAPPSPVKASMGKAKTDADAVSKKPVKKLDVESAVAKAVGQTIRKKLEKGAEIEKTEIGEGVEGKVEIKKLEAEMTENKETDTKAVKKESESAQTGREEEEEDEEEEEEEYLIITKEEYGEDSVKEEESGKENEEEAQTKDETEGEGEMKKLLREEEESEKKREVQEDKIEREADKETEMEKTEPDVKVSDQRNDEDRGRPESLGEKSPEGRESELQKLGMEVDEGIDLKEPASKEHKEGESLPEEKMSNTLETSATTAPTLPEDERIEEVVVADEGGREPEEVKEVVEEKYIQEKTKEEKPEEEKEVVPEQVQVPTAIDMEGPPLPVQTGQKKHPRDVVKTPDEVAELPVHEEVDPGMYSSGDYTKELQRRPEEETHEKPDFKAMIKGEANILDEEDGQEPPEQKIEDPVVAKYLDIIDELERSATESKKESNEKTKEEEIEEKPERQKDGGPQPEKAGLEKTSGRTTPQRKDSGRKSPLDKEHSGNVSPVDAIKDVSGRTTSKDSTITHKKDSPQETDTEVIKIPASGKTTPQDLEKETLGTSAPTQDLGQDVSGKISPKDATAEESGKSTPQVPEKDVGSEPQNVEIESSRKSSAKDLEKEIPEKLPTSGKATPEIREEEIGKAISGHKVVVDLSPSRTPESVEKEVSGKSTPQELVKEASGKSTPQELMPEVSRKSTPQDLVKEASGKSTPQELVKEASQRSTSQDLAKEISGKSTPQELVPEVSGKSTPQDLVKDISGKSSPQELMQEISRKSTPQDLVKDISGKSTPQELVKEISGKSTPQDVLKETSGKSSPQELVQEISRKPTPQDLVKEASGKSTPQEIMKEVTGKSTPQEFVKDISGKSTPQDLVIEVSEKSAPQELVKEASGKSSPQELMQEISRKSTPQELGIEVPGKPSPLEFVKDMSGKSTPQDLVKDISGKSSPQDLVVEVSGKSTPQELVKEISGKSTPQDVLKETSGKSSPQELVKETSQRSTPQEFVKDISEKSTSQDLVKEISGKSTTRELVEEISGKSTPQELVKETSGKSSPQELVQKITRISIPQDLVSGKSTQQELVEEVSGKFTPQEFVKDVSGKSTSQELVKETSQRSTPQDLVSENSTPQELVKEHSRKSTPHDLIVEVSGKSALQELVEKISGKSTPQDLVVEVSGKSTPQEFVKNISGKSTPQDLDKEIYEKSIPQEFAGKSTPQELSKEVSGKSTPQDLVKEISGKSTPEEITTDKFKEVVSENLLKEHHKASPVDHKQDLSGQFAPQDLGVEKSGKSTPQEPTKVISGKSTPQEPEKLLPGRETPQHPYKDISKRSIPSDSIYPQESGKTTPENLSGLVSGKTTPGREDMIGISGKTSRRESISENSNQISPAPSSPREVPPTVASPSFMESSAVAEKIDTREIEKAIPSDRRTSVEAAEDKMAEKVGRKVIESSESVSSGHGEKDLSGKSTPFSTDREISGKISPAGGGKPTFDSDSLALAEKGTSGTCSLEKQTSEKISSPSPVDISPLSLDDLKDEKVQRGSEGRPVGKSPIERVKCEEGRSSGTSTPERSHYEKSDGVNGVDSEDEPEKGILESERQEKESQILDISSGEEEELKGLGEDEDSETEMRREDIEGRSVVHGKEIPKGEKDGINRLVKTGGTMETEEEDASNKKVVKRMLVTASSEDGGTETEICIKTAVEKPEASDGEDEKKDKEGEFSNLILQARKEYNTQRSRNMYNSSEEVAEEEEVQEDTDEEELGNLMQQAREELAFVRMKQREMQDTESDDRKYETTTTTTTTTTTKTRSETTRMDDDHDLITITTLLTEERQEQEDGSVRVTTTKETTTTGGKNAGTVTTINTTIEKKDEEESSGERCGGKTSTEEAVETSRRTSASSIISQEDLVSRKDSAKIEDFRQSSTEMSPLKTTYITSCGDSESLMTSSFYGNLPTEDEMIGRAEHLREFRKGRGYESVTEVGPKGERMERTYFYGGEDDPRSRRERSRFVKTCYTEEDREEDGERSRFVHRFYASEIPEEETVEQTRIVQRFYEEESSSQPDETKYRFVSEAAEDFAKAVDEHVSVRGEHLRKEHQEDLAKSRKEEKEDANEGGSKTEEEKPKDVIEGWGKPLGLPLPPKNTFKLYSFPGQNISTTSTLSTPTDNSDSVSNWGHPMNLPSPAPPSTANGVAEPVPGRTPKETPKKEKKIPPGKTSGTNTPNRRSESPVKQTDRRTPSTGRNSKSAPSSHVYLDLTYVPHHGNSYYSNVEFFKKVRARYYVFSGTEPSKEVYSALLEAKQTWEDKKLEVTIIPTYDTDVLGYWVTENEEILSQNKIDLSPSASRCTINLQDHETSCSAYRLEF